LPTADGPEINMITGSLGQKFLFLAGIAYI
jgi:hypothetical protein